MGNFSAPLSAMDRSSRQKSQETHALHDTIHNIVLVYTYRTFHLGVPVMAQWLTNPTRNHEVAGLVLALAQWVKDPALP